LHTRKLNKNYFISIYLFVNKLLIYHGRNDEQGIQLNISAATSTGAFISGKKHLMDCIILLFFFAGSI
jgi:hypothetical protein